MNKISIARIAALTFLCASLSACATGPDRATVLNALVGQSETVVVRQLGVPTRTFETAGHRFLAYDEQRSTTVFDGGPFFGGGFGGPYGGGFGGGFATFPTELVPRRCETTFEIANDRVLTWSLRGNACG